MFPVSTVVQQNGCIVTSTAPSASATPASASLSEATPPTTSAAPASKGFFRPYAISPPSTPKPPPVATPPAATPHPAYRPPFSSTGVPFNNFLAYPNPYNLNLNRNKENLDLNKRPSSPPKQEVKGTTSSGEHLRALLTIYILQGYRGIGAFPSYSNGIISSSAPLTTSAPSASTIPAPLASNEHKTHSPRGHSPNRERESFRYEHRRYEQRRYEHRRCTTALKKMEWIR